LKAGSSAMQASLCRFDTEHYLIGGNVFQMPALYCRGLK
jgi:hypothetical protein